MVLKIRGSTYSLSRPRLRTFRRSELIAGKLTTAQNGAGRMTQSERRRDCHEEVAGDNHLGVIAHKRRPALAVMGYRAAAWACISSPCAAKP
jgi:hypothetical protein